MIGAPLLVKGRRFVFGIDDSKTFPTNEPENQYIRFPIENSKANVDGLVKSTKLVMPDLIRHPEHIEITGFRPAPE
ncbi:hypothetical protein [uncultured Desulfosarcina sp.]|uniref:hypothetical protein n=1 Tax=uncultured Desulfosarcina sp. TaxID=218289 RepID=UPI0029C94545|nr:hypothetical protein [uncultured Desulfosarcina sp.]